jgi:hypothetical protein
MNRRPFIKSFALLGNIFLLPCAPFYSVGASMMDTCLSDSRRYALMAGRLLAR